MDEDRPQGLRPESQGAKVLSQGSGKSPAWTRSDASAGLAPDRSVLRIMQTPVSTLQATDPVRKALDLLGPEKGRQSPVLKGDQLVGVLCNCDLSQLVAASLRELWEERRSESLDRVRIQEMVPGAAVSIGPYHSVMTAAQVLLERRVCALPVVDGRKVVGLVTQLDLLKALVDLVKELEGHLTAV